MMVGLATVFVLGSWLGLPDSLHLFGDQTSDRTVPMSDGQWNLVFADEFEGSALSAAWVTCYWWDDEGCTNKATNEQQWYVPGQVSVEDGVLKLIADEGPVVTPDGSRYPFRSGMVSSGRGTNDRTTEPGFAFRFGYVEMRARIPNGAGLWPAFWMLPITHDSKPEIDILEFLGQEPRRYSAHIHWRNDAGERRNDGHRWRGPDFSAGWHTFAVEWDAEAVTWFVDGQRVWHYDGAFVPDEPMYLIANLAVGGEYAGPTEGTTFPTSFDIDYIRVWQLAGDG